MQIIGRIQSRTYIKKLSDTLTEERTAYEVSVSKHGMCGNIKNGQVRMFATCLEV